MGGEKVRDKREANEREGERHERERERERDRGDREMISFSLIGKLALI